MIEYTVVADAVAETGMIARGGFAAAPDTAALPDGRRAMAIVMIGNAGHAMWPRFDAQRSAGSDPLDTWTRRMLSPIAEQFGASFVHPSDEPFQPFQQWAQRADDVWQSPIGLMIHPRFGLWHAYRGAFMFADDVVGLPPTGGATSPCVSCADQPCLTTCPVDAFTEAGYDDQACATHVRAHLEPVCLTRGCAARRACPIGQEYRYEADQMEFHMRAFAGLSRGE